MHWNRRSFIMAGGGTLMAQTALSDRIVVGLIGAGGRGRLLARTFQKDRSVHIGAVCDVYEPNLEAGLSEAAKAGGAPKAFRNYRQLLEDREINVVIVATPEHWHHRMVLDALAAGKDVYVEKPLCQTPEQGVELVETEKKSENIVQVGMQRRSYDLYLEARKIVASGTLGAVRMIRSWWLNNYLGPSREPRLEGPLDWEQWQGPIKKRIPLDPYIFRNWNNFSEYSGGIMAEQGVHVYDGIHLLMNASCPLAVTAAAGKPHRPRGDRPESVIVIAEYPEDFLGVFTINYAAMKYKTRNDQLNQLDGDKARMDISREAYRVYMQGAEDTSVITKTSEQGFGYATDLHVQNFLECVRTRKTPTAPMILGFQAALVVQMANISLKTGHRVRWNHTLKKVEV